MNWWSFAFDLVSFLLALRLAAWAFLGYTFNPFTWKKERSVIITVGVGKMRQVTFFGRLTPFKYDAGKYFLPCPGAFDTLEEVSSQYKTMTLAPDDIVCFQDPDQAGDDDNEFGKLLHQVLVKFQGKAQLKIAIELIFRVRDLDLYYTASNLADLVRVTATGILRRIAQSLSIEGILSNPGQERLNEEFVSGITAKVLRWGVEIVDAYIQNVDFRSDEVRKDFERVFREALQRKIEVADAQTIVHVARAILLARNIKPKGEKDEQYDRVLELEIERVRVQRVRELAAEKGHAVVLDLPSNLMALRDILNAAGGR